MTTFVRTPLLTAALCLGLVSAALAQVTLKRVTVGIGAGPGPGAPALTEYFGGDGAGTPLQGAFLGSFSPSDRLFFDDVVLITEQAGSCNVTGAAALLSVQPVGALVPLDLGGGLGEARAACTTFPCAANQRETLIDADGSISLAQFSGLGPIQLSLTVSAADIGNPFTCIIFPPKTYVATFEVGVAPLPVTLTHFSARAEGSRNVVEWAASAELDLRTYTVERATAAEVAAFATVAEVAPRGTVEGVEAVYSAYDDAPARTSYYRLRAVDRDGTVDYSAIVSVTRAGSRGVKVYPNPASAAMAVARLELDLGGDPGSLRVFDATGRAVHAAELTPGTTTYELPVAQLAAGLYTVSATSAAGVESARLVVE